VKFVNRNVYRAVLDTNVFVSGGTISAGAPSQIINRWRNQDFVAIASPELLEEYSEVLLRPKVMKYTGLNIQETIQYMEEIESRVYLTKGTLSLDVLTIDPDDNIVLACAEEGKATHLVTGNIKHFPIKEYKGIQIVKPIDFLSLLPRKYEAKLKSLHRA